MSTPATHPAELPSDSAPTAKPKIDHVEFWAGDNQMVTIDLHANGLYAVRACDGSASAATKKLQAAVLRALEMAGGDQ